MKTIPNFPKYAVTKDGKVWSYKTKRFLRPSKAHDYLHVNLRKNNKTYNRKIHRLVLSTFISSCPIGKECCHKNGKRNDNRLSNLYWGTRSENMKDAVKHKTHFAPGQKGEKHGMAKLKNTDVKLIIYMYRTKLFLQKEIAQIYKVSTDTIKRIVNKRSWKCVWN